MKVVLIRHGESEANFENYWTGWLDVSLTEKGRQQAWAAGEQIKELGISLILPLHLCCSERSSLAMPFWKPAISFGFL